VLVAVLFLGACSHRTDTGMIDAAKGFAPPESEILEVVDNSFGLTIVEGQYWAAVHIDDGGLGPGLLEAVEEQAEVGGWEERYRCDNLGGVTLGYVRDEFKVDVGVLTKKEPVTGRIRIQRLGDGNPWPGEC
jgi:hypothetical protein